MDLDVRIGGFTLTQCLVMVAATAVAAEFTLSRLRRVHFDGREAAESIAVGFAWVATRLVVGKALMFGVWVWVWQEIAPLHLPLANPATWLAYWLMGDFLYYWTHRLEHRVRLLWASHLVHHSSREFNLAAAVRQPPTEVFYKPVIALWAPLLGFHPTIYVVFGAVSLAIGQWQHLDWFPKVRLLDAVVMSPSNHRVHHGTNRQYLDRNFGGSLIIWDRLFGTYEPEVEVPRYGLLHDPRRGPLFSRLLGGYPELVDEMTEDGRTESAVGLAFGPPTA